MRLALPLSILLAATPALAQPADYVLDPKQSELVVFVYKAGVAARLAHDHVIQATKLAGTVRFDPAQPLDTALQITARADSLEVDRPELLKKHKISGTVDPDDRAEIAETLRGEEQLHVKKYPTIRFESTGLRARPKGGYLLNGRFTLRGVTKPVELEVSLALEDGVLRGAGSFQLRQSDYGYEPYSAFFGAVKVKDVVRIRVELVATLPPPPEPKQKQD